MKSRYLGVPLAAAIGLVGMAPAAHAAVQPNITCGETITTSITLNKNLTCTGIAFTVSQIDRNDTAAIVIDLGAHTVTGGILMTRSSTTLQDGHLTGSAYDEDSAGALIYQNLVLDGGGIGVGLNTFPLIRNNRFIDGASVGAGYDGVDVENNVFVNGPPGSEYVAAIALDSSFATIRNNTITGYGTGIISQNSLSSVDIENNHIAQVHGDGIQIGGTSFDAVPGVISNNVVSNNAGDGIVLGDGSGMPSPHQTAGLLVTNNTTNGNGYDGIHVDAPSPPAALGLDVTLGYNHANSNGHLGIDAPMSTTTPTYAAIIIIDGGGNTAKGNGARAQCANVVCAK